MTRPSLSAILCEAAAYDIWATPSRVPDVDEPQMRRDQSISVGALGSPLEHNLCVGALEEDIAEARGGRRAWAVTNGSTGCNQIAMATICRRSAWPRVLVAANCHHSILNICLELGVEIRVLPGSVQSAYGAILPPRPEDIDAALRADPSITAVVISDPTYEGLRGDVPAISKVVHAHGLPLVQDAAWGAHFGYHASLPAPAAALGADLVVESLHKTGGAAQGSAAVLLGGSYLSEEEVDISYKRLITTSPSFPMLSTIEVALRALRADGRRYLDVPLRHAAELRAGLAERGLPVLDHAQLADLTKVTFGGLVGYEVEERLLKHGIVVEKASPQSTLMLATMQLRHGAAERALTAIDELLAVTELREVAATTVEPLHWLSAAPAVEAHALRGRATERVPFAHAAGRVAAETVELYPPGIPVLAPGWVIEADGLYALDSARAAHARLVAEDRDLCTIRVLSASAA